MHAAGARGRFIPTYMGNARVTSLWRVFTSVHPHVHGERQPTAGSEWCHVGSSPRTWGTLVTIPDIIPRPRFIPTYMGNASSTGSPGSAGAVHPHVHGERRSSGQTSLGIFGSSPRTWGTLPEPLPHPGISRFIPTYMGNASWRNASVRLISVHPHVHGERTNWPR